MKRGLTFTVLAAVLLFYLLFTPVGVWSDIPQSERDALIALYNATNGDSWTTKTNWRDPVDPAQFNAPGTEHTWHGITLDAGSYNWSVPNIPSTSCLVRVTDLTGPANDTGDAAFTITENRGLTLTAPNGGETWAADSQQTITWTSEGQISNVHLEYSSDGGGSWNTIAASAGNTGSYTWTVPHLDSTACLVRITDTGGQASDTGDNPFTIFLQSSITLLSPNGGESWKRRSTQTITWTSGGGVGNVKIQYSTNNGGSWRTITSSTANDGSYSWRLPRVWWTQDDCLVRIMETDGSPSDTSDGMFTIYR